MSEEEPGEGSMTEGVRLEQEKKMSKVFVERRVNDEWKWPSGKSRVITTEEVTTELLHSIASDTRIPSWEIDCRFHRGEAIKTKFVTYRPV